MTIEQLAGQPEDERGAVMSVACLPESATDPHRYVSCKPRADALAVSDVRLTDPETGRWLVALLYKHQECIEEES